MMRVTRHTFPIAPPVVLIWQALVTTTLLPLLLGADFHVYLCVAAMRALQVTATAPPGTHARMRARSMPRVLT